MPFAMSQPMTLRARPSESFWFVIVLSLSGWLSVWPSIWSLVTPAFWSRKSLSWVMTSVLAGVSRIVSLPESNSILPGIFTWWPSSCTLPVALIAGAALGAALGVGSGAGALVAGGGGVVEAPVFRETFASPPPQPPRETAPIRAVDDASTSMETISLRDMSKRLLGGLDWPNETRQTERGRDY